MISFFVIVLLCFTASSFEHTRKFRLPANRRQNSSHLSARSAAICLTMCRCFCFSSPLMCYLLPFCLHKTRNTIHFKLQNYTQTHTHAYSHEHNTLCDLPAAAPQTKQKVTSFRTRLGKSSSHCGEYTTIARKSLFIHLTAAIINLRGFTNGCWAHHIGLTLGSHTHVRARKTFTFRERLPPKSL